MPDFGIGELITALAVDAGVGATTAGVIGSIAGPALIGAAGGTVLGAIEGDPGAGALAGGLGGFGIGAGGVLAPELGIGLTAGEALGGAAAGALSSGISGTNPLTGAIEGGAAGALSGALSTPSGTPSGSATSGGASASSAAPTPGAAAATLGGGTGDLTATGSFSGLDTANLTLPGPGGVPSNLSQFSAATPGTGDLSTTTGPGGTVPANLSVLPTVDPTNAAGTVASNVADFGKTAATYGVGSDAGGGTFGKIGSFLEKNPGAALAGGGLLLNMLQKNNIPGLDQLTSQANQLSSTGAGLQSYIQNGTLPAGMQAALDRQVQAQSAAIRSKYASMGMSGSTAEVTDLNNIRTAATEQAFSFADRLLQQGISDAGLSAQLFESITRLNQEENQQTGQAIASLAAALGGLKQAA